MTTIAVLNQKGGVGKTTTAVNLGAGLAAAGRRVLLVDLDPQANLTVSVGLPADPARRTVYDVLRERCKLADAITNAAGCAVLPASIDLSAAEVELSGEPGRERLLSDALTRSGYDYTLIDCPPSLGLLTLNGLTAADEVLIPVQVEFLALQGLAALTRTIEVVRRRLNHGLTIGMVVCTRFDNRRNLNREVLDKIREHFGDKVAATTIRENIALAEAPSHGQTIYEYQGGSHGADDYRELAREFERKHKGGKTG